MVLDCAGEGYARHIFLLFLVSTRPGVLAVGAASRKTLTAGRWLSTAVAMITRRSRQIMPPFVFPFLTNNRSTTGCRLRQHGTRSSMCYDTNTIQQVALESLLCFGGDCNRHDAVPTVDQGLLRQVLGEFRS